MKIIGIVCEGDRDYEMLKSVIGCFFEEEYRTLFLQPNPEFGTDNGNGWKGIIRWCQNRASDMYQYLKDIVPSIDLLIIHMDADVARCEKEIYCPNIQVDCNEQGTEDFLNCSVKKEKECLQVLPPNAVCDGTPQGRVEYLNRFIYKIIGDDERICSVVTIPCDATDAWIVAAYEDGMDEVEQLDSPWDLISHGKCYHGIRIPKRKQSRIPYGKMIDKVCDRWQKIKQKCPQALKFECEVLEQLKTPCLE